MTIREKESSAPLEKAGTTANIPIAHATAVVEDFSSSEPPNWNVAVATGAPILRANTTAVQQQQQRQRRNQGCCNSGHGWCCITTAIVSGVCILCILPILIFFMAAATTLQKNINGASNEDELWIDDAYFDDAYWQNTDLGYPGN